MQKGNQNKENNKFEPPNQKDKNQYLDEPSCSRRNRQRGKEKKKFSYCARGFHIKISCMKRTIDHMAFLLDKNNIPLPEGIRKKYTAS